MKRIVCTECKVKMLVGDRMAMCEQCRKIVDLRPKKGGTYHHPLVLACVLVAFLALVVSTALMG